MALCGQLDPPFRVGHLVLNLLSFRTHLASAERSQGKSELCFLETLQLDTMVLGVIINTFLLLRREAKLLIIVPYVFKIKRPLGTQSYKGGVSAKFKKSKLARSVNSYRFPLALLSMTKYY